jgi:hypothetical protein
VMLYPFYLLISFVLSMGFLCKNSRRHRGIPSRVLAGASLLVALPVHVAAALYRLGRPASSVGRVSAARLRPTETASPVPISAEPT